MKTAETTRPAERPPSARPTRIPVGTRNVLTAPKKEGYIRRFRNDEHGRIQQCEAAGYTVVKEDVAVGDPRIGKEQNPGSVVSVPVGGGTKAVLMEIREDWYEEDQKAKQDKILMAENDMKRKLNARREGIYGGVEIV